MSDTNDGISFGAMSNSSKRDDLVREINAETMSDPLQENSKHFRKGLVLSGFIAILIGSFSVKFESFLGFRIAEGTVGPAIFEGVLFLIVLYYLISYCINISADLLGWSFRRERVRAKEYTHALFDLTEQIKYVFQGLESANCNFKEIYAHSTRPSESMALFSQELIDVRNKFRHMSEGFVEEFKKDQQILRTIGKFNFRSKLKIWGLVIIDVLFPAGIAVLAFAKTWGGVSATSTAILG